MVHVHPPIWSRLDIEGNYKIVERRRQERIYAAEKKDIVIKSKNVRE
jgi:hypothetical protein